jgi:murein DD-endopeptidase MepM/ murein hydrolase activator NlpD
VADKKDLNNYSLEPIYGQPGWYWDKKSGQTINESDLTSHMEDYDESGEYVDLEHEYPSEYEEDAEDYSPYDSNGAEETAEDETGSSSGADGGEIGRTQEDTEGGPLDSEPDDSNKADKSESQGDESGAPPIDSGGSGELPGGKKDPMDALDTLPTDQMGKAGENIDDAKRLYHDAKAAARAIESEGADLEADLELAKDAPWLIGQGVKNNIRSCLISWVALMIPFMVISAVFIMAFFGMGSEGDSAYGGETGTTGTGTLIGEYYMPVETGVGFKLGSRFGMRWHPTKNIWKMHEGVDISIGGGNPDPDDGRPVFSVQSGKIVYVDRKSNSCATIIKVDHGNGFLTQYIHMMKDDGIGIKVGDTVSGGQQIAKISPWNSTQRKCSTGSHLHFETISNGSKVDPEGIIDFSKL